MKPHARASAQIASMHFMHRHFPEHFMVCGVLQRVLTLTCASASALQRSSETRYRKAPRNWSDESSVWWRLYKAGATGKRSRSTTKAFSLQFTSGLSQAACDCFPSMCVCHILQILMFLILSSGHFGFAPCTARDSGTVSRT